jgi:hypothetical protein
MHVLITCQVSGWTVWIPVVTIVYCLPQPLQLPVQNMVLSFWILVLSMANSAKPTAATTPSDATTPSITDDAEGDASPSALTVRASHHENTSNT